MRLIWHPCIAGAWGKLPHLPPPLWVALHVGNGLLAEDVDKLTSERRGIL
jgi:hypothetical protein